MTTVTLTLPIVLIGSLVVVSLLGWAHRAVLSALVLRPYQVRHQGEVHRLLTGAWVHSDLGHLAFNSLSLYFFAAPVQKAFGEAQFLVLYVSAAVVAFLPTTLRYMNKPSYSSLGASGAIAAVMFSSILLAPEQKLYLFFLPMGVPGYLFAVGYLAYSAWHSYRSSDNVNHDAHFYGAAYGLLFTYLSDPIAAKQGIDAILKSIA